MSEPQPQRIYVQVRQVPEYGVELDGVWIRWEFLEELLEQDRWMSQAGPGDALLSPSRDVTRVLEERGLLERETRGGVHRGDALREWMGAAEFPDVSGSVAPVAGEV